MSFLLFLRGFIAVLVVFAIVTYVATQSVWTTFLHTVICAVIIQIGYFMAVLVLVWWSPGRRRKSSDVTTRNEAAKTAAKKDQPVVR